MLTTYGLGDLFISDEARVIRKLRDKKKGKTGRHTGPVSPERAARDALWARVSDGEEHRLIAGVDCDGNVKRFRKWLESRCLPTFSKYSCKTDGNAIIVRITRDS